MNADSLYETIVAPAMVFLSGISESKIRMTPQAGVMLTAIAGQESDWRHRRQVGGPARSFWQFEQGGGVNGVMTHPATKDYAAKVFAAFDVGEPSLGAFVQPSTKTVYEAMAWHDKLAACMARLNLWWAAPPLPNVDEVDKAWSYYLDTWRPGAPHRETWDAKHAAARKAVLG